MAFGIESLIPAVSGIQSAVGGKQKVQIIQNNNTVITFDASISETHSRQSEPTEFPVENGTTVSDHIIIRPFKLELQGVITDSPVGGKKSLLTEAATTLVSALVPPVGLVALGAGLSIFNAVAKSPIPSVAAYGQLLQLQAGSANTGPVPFDVLTTLYRYPNMWINSISVPRSAQTANELLFTLSLVQLIIVSPQSVNLQIFANPGLAAGSADAGDQSGGLASGFKAGQFDALKATGILH